MVGSRESHSINNIPNNYIYDAFLMTLFVYFIVVVFPLFGTSRELISDYEGCNFVIS